VDLDIVLSLAIIVYIECWIKEQTQQGQPPIKNMHNYVTAFM